MEEKEIMEILAISGALLLTHLKEHHPEISSDDRTDFLSDNCEKLSRVIASDDAQDKLKDILENI